MLLFIGPLWTGSSKSYVYGEEALLCILEAVKHHALYQNSMLEKLHKKYHDS